jgi:hypothetical protein
MKRFEPVMEFDGTGMAEDDDGNWVEYDEALEAIANARSELQAVIDEMRNNVNHPNHYAFGKYEPIDVIEDWELGFHLGCALKYIARAGRKTVEPTEDLEKARWYLARAIEQFKNPKGEK